MNEDFMRKAEIAKIGLENGSLKIMNRRCDSSGVFYRESEDGVKDVIKKALEMVLGSKNTDVVPMSGA